MSGTATPAGLGRLRRLPLGAHVALLVVVLAVLAPFLHLEETYTSDEGAYATQVRDLDDGHWEYRYAAQRYDPEGRWFPLANASHSANGWFAYVQHPAYPVLVLGATKVAGGVVGLHLPALVGAVGLAVAAWLLAAETEQAAWARRGAFWLAASGPAFVHAYIQWAHALSAAVAGFTLLAAVRLARSDRQAPAVLPLAGLVAGSVAGVLLRSEGLLFAAAVAGGLFLVGLRGRPLAQRVAIPALCLGAAVVTTVVEQRWISSIIGGDAGFRGARGTVRTPGAGAGNASGSSGARLVDWVSGRLNGAFRTVLEGAHSETGLATLVLVALVMVGYAAWAYHRRRPGWERDVTVGLATAAAMYVLRALADRTEAVSGILAAWPLVLLGLAVVARRLPKGTGLPAAVIALFVLAVLATQYRIGGGLEWGGRFLAPAYAPLAVLACLGLHRLLVALPASSAGGAWRRVVVGSAALLAVAPLVTGVVLIESSRSLSGRLIDEVTAVSPAGGQLVVTDIVALPRAAWRTYPAVGWMLIPAGDVDEVTAALAAGGARRVTLLVPARTPRSALVGFPTVSDVTGPVARSLGRSTYELSAP